MIAVVVTQARNKQLFLDLFAEFAALLHLCRDGLLPGDVLLTVCVTLDLHYELFDLSEVAISIGTRAQQSHACRQFGQLGKHNLS